MQTLILNKDYAILSVCSWQAAITALHSGKARVLEEYDEVVRSAYLTMKIPAVIVVNEYVKKPVKNLKFSRASVYARDRFSCCYCGEKCKTFELTYDHVIPRSQGGKTDWFNIVSACMPCNSRKGGRTPEQAKMKLLRKPVRPRAVPQMQFEFIGKEVPEQWRDFVYWNSELESDG